MNEVEDVADGFTLLETLVAMIFLALLASFGIQSIQRLNDVKQVEKTIARIDSIQSTRQHLRQIIAGARPTMTSNSKGDAKLDFKGTQTSLMLTNILDDRLVNGRLSRIIYGEIGTALALRVLNLEDEQTPNDNSTKLLENLEQLKFDYFGIAKGQDIAAWHSSWDENYLPKAVRINLTLNTEGAETWEPLVINLALAK